MRPFSATASSPPSSRRRRSRFPEAASIQKRGTSRGATAYLRWAWRAVVSSGSMKSTAAAPREAGRSQLRPLLNSMRTARPSSCFPLSSRPLPGSGVHQRQAQSFRRKGGGARQVRPHAQQRHRQPALRDREGGAAVHRHPHPVLPAAHVGQTQIAEAVLDQAGCRGGARIADGAGAVRGQEFNVGGEAGSLIGGGGFGKRKAEGRGEQEAGCPPAAGWCAAPGAGAAGRLRYFRRAGRRSSSSSIHSSAPAWPANPASMSASVWESEPPVDTSPCSTQ